VVLEVPSSINPLKWNSPGRRCALEGLISEVILKQFYSFLVFRTFRHSRPTGFPIFIGTGLSYRLLLNAAGGGLGFIDRAALKAQQMFR
jgi:hypothetical protein